MAMYVHKSQANSATEKPGYVAGKIAKGLVHQIQFALCFSIHKATGPV